MAERHATFFQIELELIGHSTSKVGIIAAENGQVNEPPPGLRALKKDHYLLRIDTKVLHLKTMKRCECPGCLGEDIVWPQEDLPDQLICRGL